jgi:adenine deaminase
MVMRKGKTPRGDLIDVALKRKPADKIVFGGKVVNVYTSEIRECNIAIVGDRIAAVDGFDVSELKGPSTQCIDAAGAYLTPGLVEPHLHSYHSYMTMENFAQAMLVHGTTAYADGFYGQGIVGGIEAIKLMIEEVERTPLKLIFSLPVLSYLQNRELGIDPAPNSLSEKQLFDMLDWPEIDGLEEPPYLPIVHKEDVFVRLFEQANKRGIPITGHAAGISIPQLNAYAAAGTISDHEQTDAKGAIEVARRGVKVLMRLGSGAPDLRELSKAITEDGINPRCFAFCADLAAPEKLFHDGDMDACIRAAVTAGIPPINAIQMATLNAAEVYNLQGEIGSISPGKFADILFVKDIRDFEIMKVMADGEIVVEDGVYLPKTTQKVYPAFMRDTVKLDKPVSPDSFEIRANGNRARVRAILAVDQSLYTHEHFAELAVNDGVVEPDVDKDILRIAMVDRHFQNGSIGNGFVKGFGLKKGAVASSVNAVCENIVVIGTNNADMAHAVNHLAKIGGGKVVVVDGKIAALIELPVLGLLSDEPLEAVVRKFDNAYAQLRQLGCTLTSPFATLEFCCACGEIGKLKIFDKGYIDVENVRRVATVEVSAAEAA